MKARLVKNTAIAAAVFVGLGMTTPSGVARAEMGPASATVIVEQGDFTGAENFEAIDGVLSPDGSTYYAIVANPNTPESRLLVVDVATQAVESSLVLQNSSGSDTSARFIAIQPNGARVWVSLDESTDGMLLIPTADPDSDNDGIADADYLLVSSTNPIDTPGPVDFNLNGSSAFFVTERDTRSITRFSGASNSSPIFGQRLYAPNTEELWQSVAAIGNRVYATKSDRLVLWGPDDNVLSYLNNSALAEAESTPDESQLWVSRTSADRILRITITGNSNVSSEQVSQLYVKGPREIVFSQTNPAGVVVGDDDTGQATRFSLFNTDDGERIGQIDVDTAQSDPVGLGIVPDGSVAYSIYTDVQQSKIMLLEVQTNFSNRAIPDNAPSLGFAGTVPDGAVCSGQTLEVKEAVLAKDGETLLAVETLFVSGVGHSAVRIIDLNDLSTRVSCLQRSSSISEGQIGYYAALDPRGDYLWVSGGEPLGQGFIGMAGVWEVDKLQSPQSDEPVARWKFQTRVNQLVFRPRSDLSTTEALLSDGAGVLRLFFPTSTPSTKAIAGLQRTAAGANHLFTSTSTTVAAYPYTTIEGTSSAVASSTYTLGTSASSITVSPDNTELWVTVGSQSRIVVLNTADLSEKAEITSYLANPQAVAFHPTDGTALVADANGVKVFDADSKDYLTGYNIKTEQSLSADINVRSIVVSAAGDKVALVDINDGTYVVNYEVATPSTQSSEDTDEPLSDPSIQKPTSPSSPSTLTPPDSPSPTSDTSEEQEKSAEETVESDSQESPDGELDPAQEGEFSGTAEPNELAAPPSQGPIPPWLIATSIGALFLLGAGASALWWRGRRA